MAELTLILESRPHRWDLESLDVTQTSSDDEIFSALELELDGKDLFGFVIQHEENGDICVFPKSTAGII